MREVSCKATRILLEALEEAGIAVEPLVAGLPVTLAELRDPGGRVDWDVFAELNDRVEAVSHGAGLSLEEVGARMLVVPSFDFLRRAGQLLVSPRQLYGLANRMVAPALFPHVIVRQEWLPTGRLVVTGELPPGYRECTAFFRICHGNVVALPRLLDLPPATIEEQVVSGRRGRLILIPPASHTIGARLRRGARAAFTIGETFRGVARQQTELEASLTALRTSRHELRQLIERLPEGVLIHRDAIVCWANAVMLQLLGYERLDQIVGRHVLEFMPPTDRAAVAAAMAKALPRQVTDERLEYRVLRPDGTLRRVQSGTAQHVDFEGAPARLVVLRDVTEHHRLQEQLALADRMASLGTLAAGVAHEINNPLAYTHMSLEVASRELAGLGEPTRGARLEEALGRAREGTERVRGIVRDLKTLSRAGDEPLEAVALPALLESTLAVAANAIAAKAQVVRRFRPVPHALASRARLGQVFLNLLLNAADAIPDGAPERHVIGVSTSTDAAGRAVIEISDSGTGIAPDVAKRVFDPFFTTKAVGTGTGLGLAICHRIVAQLGGDIDFAPTAGGGTTFRLTLPAAPAAGGAVAVGSAPGVAPSTPSASFARGRVLVVDDEPALLRSVRDFLGEIHEVVTASSGRQALEVLRADRAFDVVLADLMMADLTGMDLHDAVRAAHPGLERRILFMTGGAFTERSRAFLDEVPNRCLEKPFGGEELLTALADALARGGGAARG